MWLTHIIAYLLAYLFGLWANNQACRNASHFWITSFTFSDSSARCVFHSVTEGARFCSTTLSLRLEAWKQWETGMGSTESPWVLLSSPGGPSMFSLPLLHMRSPSLFVASLSQKNSLL